MAEHKRAVRFRQLLTRILKGPKKIILRQDDWQRQHDEVSKNLRTTMLTLLLYSLLCLLALGAPDVSMIGRESGIKMPLAGTNINYFAFLGVAPVVLVALTIYVHILIGYCLRLVTFPDNNAVTLPFLFNMTSIGARFLTTFIFYWVPIILLYVFYWKSKPFPILSVYLFRLFIFISIWLWLVHIIRYCREEPQRNALRWIAFSLLRWITFIIRAFKVKKYNIKNQCLSAHTSALSNRRSRDQREPTTGNKAVTLQSILVTLKALIFIILPPILVFLYLFLADPYRAMLLSGANFCDRDFRGLSLKWATLTNAKLIRSNLSSANLIGADLNEADLTRAILTDADLRQSELINANLNGADLEGANLREANLYGTILDSANVRGADLRKVKGLKCEGLHKAIGWKTTLRDNTLKCQSFLEASEAISEKQELKKEPINERKVVDLATSSLGRPQKQLLKSRFYTDRIPLKGCDLRFMVASDANPENELIRKFEMEFDSNKKECNLKKKKCLVLIVRATSDSGKWTIAGFSDSEEFRTVVIDEPSDKLAQELKKEPINERKVIEIATSRLGRTPLKDGSIEFKLYVPTNYQGCDLRLIDASDADADPEDKLIRKFEMEFDSNKKECAVLIVRPKSGSKEWIVAGFDDAGEFVIDEPSDELAQELKKESFSKQKVVEMATSHLGRAQKEKRPLIVMLHGCYQNPDKIAKQTRMNVVADENTFMVVYPTNNNLQKCWRWFDNQHQYRDKGEPRNIAEVVKYVKKNYLIDEKRVYAAGHSAGAAMTVILGATYPDIFAAIAVSSGLEYKAATTKTGGAALPSLFLGGPNPKKQGKLAYCAMGDHARVVPVIVFDGTLDVIVRPRNAKQVIRQWAHTNDLALNGILDGDVDAKPDCEKEFKVSIPDGRSYYRRDYLDNKGRVIVMTRYTVEGMRHGWSGGKVTSYFGDLYVEPLGPDATRLIWEFFSNSERARCMEND